MSAAWQGVGSIGAVKKVEVAGSAPANVRLASPEGTTQWAAATPVVETPAGQLAAKQDAAQAAVLAPRDPALPQNNNNGTDPVAGALRRRSLLQGGPRRSLAAATFGNTYTNYGAAWQLNQMPPPPLSFRITLANGQVVRIETESGMAL